MLLSLVSTDVKIDLTDRKLVDLEFSSGNNNNQSSSSSNNNNNNNNNNTHAFGIAPFFINRGAVLQSGNEDQRHYALTAPTTSKNLLRVLRALQLHKAILLEVLFILKPFFLIIFFCFFVFFLFFFLIFLIFFFFF